MFGFPDVSAAGGAIERLVEGVMASTAVTGSTGEPAVLQQLLNCNEQLARELDAAGDTAPSSAGMVFRGQAAADRTESLSRPALQMPESL